MRKLLRFPHGFHLPFFRFLSVLKGLYFPNIHFANAFIGNYLRLDLLARAGLASQILRETKGYFKYMADRTGTLWENDTTCASCNHGFASYAALLLVKCVLGADVDLPSKTLYLTAPDVTGLDFCGATLPVGDATLDVDRVTCVFGDPLFVTPMTNLLALTGSDLAAQPPRTLPSKWTTPSYAALISFNVHLRGGSGYVDEKTGEKVTACRRKGNSPAIDAGDKSVKCVEPKPNGHRVNMGCYGNTPWATRSKSGTLLFVR